MEIPSIPSLICPHCYTPNRMFASQRCQNCKVAMMSDREFKLLSKEIKPLAADLRMSLLQIESGKANMMASPRIQLLLSQLEPYKEDRPWMEQYIRDVRRAVEPLQEYYGNYRKNLIASFVILAILALVPIVAASLRADPIMTGLLFLPVPGWYFLGIRPLMKKYN